MTSKFDWKIDDVEVHGTTPNEVSKLMIVAAIDRMIRRELQNVDINPDLRTSLVQNRNRVASFIGLERAPLSSFLTKRD